MEIYQVQVKAIEVKEKTLKVEILVGDMEQKVANITKESVKKAIDTGNIFNG